MFERFTERARKVVVLGQEEARRLRHGYVGTEHLLLGLLREKDGVAAQALVASGVTLGGAREQVAGIVGYGEEIDFSQAPFAQHAKAALELSLGEALRLRHNYIGTEHLLLGLLRENGALTRRILGNLGVEPEGIRQEVVRRLGSGPRSQPRKDPGPMAWTREVLRRSFGRSSREGESLFGKLAESARRVVVLAQDEARRFNHNYIGTEHLLLGLLREEGGIGAGALQALGVDIDGAREQVETIVGYGEEEIGAQAPFTPRSKKVLQLAEREALQLGDDHVGGEHVLLGLVRETEGVAARVLLSLDVDPDAVRREVIRRLPDGAVEADSLDEVEREMEEEERQTRRLFRGRVTGIRAELALPRPVSVSVDADYSYRTPAGSADDSPTVEPGDVADLLRDGLGEAGARSVQTVVTTLGERLLGAFPAMLEATVTVSGAPEPADPPAPMFSVSSTFRR